MQTNNRYFIEKSGKFNVVVRTLVESFYECNVDSFTAKRELMDFYYRMSQCTENFYELSLDIYLKLIIRGHFTDVYNEAY